MPISCHFQDCEALLFVLTTCKQRYIKYSGFTFFLPHVNYIQLRNLACFRTTSLL